MSHKSSIEWTNATWNPVRGCTEISSGCARCYAKVFAERFRGVPGHPYEHGFDIRIVPEKLREPLKWKKPSLIFVNSMSDLFHREIPDDYIEQVVQTMVEADWHTYQILTKRSDRLASMLNGQLSKYRHLEHIWWGVSVENQKQGLPRIDDLRRAAPAISFLSIEPLLEDLGTVSFQDIDWVIVGGESGPKSRPMEKEWVTSLRDQCVAQQIPFFFKQWGGTRKHLTGRELEGRTWDEFPKVAHSMDRKLRIAVTE